MYKLGVIGAGNMATGIVRGVLNFLSPSDIIISDVSESQLTHFASLGVSTTTDNLSVCKNSGYVLFAIKPQYFAVAAERIRGNIQSGKVISIMAGLKIEKIRAALGDVSIARVMPNMPAMVGAGMSCVTFADCSSEDKAFVLDCFRSCGKAIEVSESDMDAVTSVSGSGPAYVYMFIQGMIEGGISGGLSPEIAKELTLQTFVGAVEMARNKEDLNAAIDAVCSKGGTTIEAIKHYKENNLTEIIKEGVEKCRKRSEELSRA